MKQALDYKYLTKDEGESKGKKRSNQHRGKCHRVAGQEGKGENSKTWREDLTPVWKDGDMRCKQGHDWNQSQREKNGAPRC